MSGISLRILRRAQVSRIPLIPVKSGKPSHFYKLTTNRNILFSGTDKSIFWWSSSGRLYPTLCSKLDACRWERLFVYSCRFRTRMSRNCKNCRKKQSLSSLRWKEQPVVSPRWWCTNEAEAKHIGLGTNLAMKRFDTMVSHFHEALNKAAIDLELQGFVHAHNLKEKILSSGGICYQ